MKMDRSWVACLLVSVCTCFMKNPNALANDELADVKKMMPRLHHDRKIMQLVEKQLMDVFGFSKKVKPRRRLHVPNHLWTMYRKWSGELYDDTDKMANVVRILHHDDSKPRTGENSMLFNLNSLPKNENIRRAELHIRKTGKASTSSRSKIHLHAHSHYDGSSRARRSLVEERHLNMSLPDWEKFDVTSVVQGWMQNRMKEHKFSMDVIDDSGGRGRSQDVMILNKIAPSAATVQEWERKRPFLVIEGAHVGMKRERRDAHVGYDSRESNRHSSRHRARKLHEKAKLEMCRRRNFYLDFQSIGWSKQIVHPMGFHMYYCQGTCPKPLGSHMNTTNHAVIQNQVNSFDPTLVPPPCCVPSSLGDTNILYIDMGNQIVMKTYADIVVEGCGCR